MRQFQHQQLCDTELILDDKDHNYLGPDLVLDRCRLVFRASANAVTITHLQLLRCDIEVQKKLCNFQMWCAAAIRGCTFRGHYVGNDFGHWPEQHPEGVIENCNLSDAILDGCRFMGCELDSIAFPKWPCFTIPHPHSKLTDVESFQWPGDLRIWATVVADCPTPTVASVNYAPTLAKQFRCSEEEIRNALIQLGDVLM